jgi:hypothetical protein
MNINTDINILGSILDLTLISKTLNIDREKGSKDPNALSNTSLKTTRSLERYERAIRKTLVFFKKDELRDLFTTVFANEGLSEDCLSLLFLNISFNNELLDYLNQSIFFPAYFSGRIAIKKSEIVACINDLRQTEESIREWSASTIDVMARKYLALLDKFNLMEGGRYKSIKYRYINDKQLITFAYWLITIESKPNLLESKWLSYGFLEKESFRERILQKKFMKYLDVTYTGDSMKLEPRISYKDIYNELAKS